jgi:ATP-dependent protease ClpP protease subunit
MFQLLQPQDEEDFVRYVYYFNNEITTETVNELIGILSSVPSVDLFVTTPGGETTASQALIHFINNHPDIKIYLTGYIASAGTDFLTDCNKEVFLTDDLDWILFHQADREFGGKFRKAMLDKDILYNQTKEINDRYAEKYKKLGLNSKEIKEYFKGEDVILYRKDFGRLKVNRK